MPTKFSGMAGALAFEMLNCCTPRSECPKPALETNIFMQPVEMAATYLYHIVQNHPFIDGNKRAGAMAAIEFLKLNGFTLEADESVFEKLVLQAAQGQAGKDAIADFFREHTKS